uniref:GH10 domain-containing protein n=1 Tax=Oryza brachyantha TaxID=4533 RepID=J3N1Z6_ORYBR
MVQSVPYDHTASIECLSNPMRPLYNGGVIKNSKFDRGLTDWSVPWDVKATVSSSPSGNKFAEATTDGQPSHTVYQTVQMQPNTHYSLSAWLQVSAGTANVKAVIKTPDGQYVAAGATVAKAGCWSMIKGGMTAYSSGLGQLYFEADAAVVIWVDSVSLQPFSFAEWDAHRQQSAGRARRSTVRMAARGPGGTPAANATVSVELLRPAFPLGNAMTREILDIPAYEQWFASRFTVATFENEMKWYSTEPSRGNEDYGVADAMLALAERRGIRVRGHNVFWDDQSTQMAWVRSLGPDELRSAMERRLRSVVSRYAGRVIGWDVVNENLHWSFFEGRLGPDASPAAYRRVAEIDGAAPLFMNEFNTVEQPMDMAAMSSKYVAKMNQIRAFPGNGGLKLAVGPESHFRTPHIPFMRATLDTLSQLNVPIWLTEIDVTNGPNQAQHLEEVLREGYGHPSVDGMVMWAAWHAQGCYVMCLTDNDFKNLAVGDVVDKLIAEWRTHPVAATTDADGLVELDLVHGEYNVTVTHHPSSPLVPSAVRTLTVEASSSASSSSVSGKV